MTRDPVGDALPPAAPWLVLAALPLILAAFLSARPGGEVQAWMVVGAHIMIVGCLGLGIRRYRPSGVTVWTLLLAGQILYVAADAIFLLTPLWRPLPFPSRADIFYVLSYLVTFVALVQLARRRSPVRDRSTLLDSAIVTIGLSAVSYVFLLEPFFDAPDLDSLTRLTSFAYPVIDILLLAVFVRVAFTWRRATPAFLGLLGMLVIQLVTNFVYSTMQLDGSYSPVVKAGFLASWWLLCVGALHPSMRQLAEPAGRTSGSAPTRLWFLAGAAVLPPALIVVGVARESLEREEIAVLAVLSIVLFLLVVARVHGLMVNELRLRAQHAAAKERLGVMQDVTRLMERERAATAAEIHDGPVQHLPSLALQLARADLRLNRGDVAGGREISERVRVALEHEVGDLRRMMAGLHPPLLEHSGVEAAVRHLGSELAARTGCSVSVDASLSGRLATETEFVLFRVTQEALANVAKHAGARTVRVLLSQRPESIELEITDDGRGFEPVRTTTADGRHFGLSAMRERVGALGGSLHVASSPGLGTTLVATIPWEEDAR